MTDFPLNFVVWRNGVGLDNVSIRAALSVAIARGWALNHGDDRIDIDEAVKIADEEPARIYLTRKRRTRVTPLLS